MSGLLQDLRYGARVLLRSPGPTSVALLALAIGIGLNLASFTFVNALVLHPLPFPHLERVMTVWETVTKLHSQRDPLAPANFLDWSRQTKSFDQIASYRSWSANLTGTSEPVRVQGTLVSPSFFAVVGVRPALGRPFSGDEAQTSHSRVLIVSDGFWRQYLAGSPQALGKSIILDRETYTVIGIMPADFDFPLTNNIWAPLSLDLPEQAQRSKRTLKVLALLKPNISVEQARKEAEQIAGRLERQFPLTNESRSISVLPLRSVINAVTQRFVLILLGSATFTLLLACANVANLQLARAVSREKEIAVRAALGANRFQIARQLFAESVLLAVGGSLLALLLASWDLAFFRSTIPPEVFAFVAGLRTMHMDPYVAAYVIALSLLTALLCSLPAIAHLLYQRSRNDLNDAIRSGARTSSIAPTRNRMQSVLIVYEVSIALVLLIGAGFMVKMFNGVLAGHYGYDPKNILQLRISLPAASYKNDAQLINFYDRLLPMLQTIPGSQAAAVWSQGAAERLLIEGRPESRPGDPQPEVQSVSESFLASMRIPLLKGRFIANRDRPDSARIVVLSQEIAQAYWPDSDPIGRRIKLGDSSSPWLTVVGVSGDIVQDWFSGRPTLSAYVPYTQHATRSAEFVLRTLNNPVQAGSAARQAVRKADKDLPVYGLKSMEREMFEETSGIRAAARAMSVYAGVALLLAATGIFAMISYFVAQRTHDIGVRMALGAGAGDVLKLTLSATLRLTFRGLLMGSLLAFGLMKLVSSLLSNLVKLDFVTFAVCAAVLAVAALLASYLPAYRAINIDPLVALREE